MPQKKKIEFYKQTPVAEKEHKVANTDDLLKGTDKLEFLVGQYWKQILIGFGVIALVVVALIIIAHVRTEKDNAIRKDFANAVTVETLAPLINKNSSHPASIPARFKLADLYCDSGDFSNASKTLKEIVDSSDADAYLRVDASLKLAYTQELSNRDAEALVSFISVMSNPGATEEQRAEAQYGVARLYIKANNTDAANKCLENANPNTFWGMQSLNLKKNLNLPPVPPVTAPKVTATPAPVKKDASKVADSAKTAPVKKDAPKAAVTAVETKVKEAVPAPEKVSSAASVSKSEVKAVTSPKTAEKNNPVPAVAK